MSSARAPSPLSPESTTEAAGGGATGRGAELGCASVAGGSVVGGGVTVVVFPFPSTGRELNRRRRVRMGDVVSNLPSPCIGTNASSLPYHPPALVRFKASPHRDVTTSAIRGDVHAGSATVAPRSKPTLEPLPSSLRAKRAPISPLVTSSGASTPIPSLMVLTFIPEE